MEGTQLPQTKTLFVNNDVLWLAPMDWSPDGRWIVVQLTRADRTDQLALVATGDGSLRVLKSSEWRGALEVFFSPDGKYLGFDLPADDTNSQRDVFVIAVDGSRQTGIALGRSHDTMIGWSPDGTRLLFASDRSGSTGLWSQLMVDGRPQSAPELLKTEIARDSVGVTRAGRLYTGVDIGNRDINVVTVDFATGKALSAPIRPIQSFVGSNQQPAWSRDGKSMAFISARDRAGINRVLGIYSADTGLVRELRPELAYFDGPDWAPDGRSVVVRGRNLKGVRGAYAIDVQSGAATRVVSPGDGGGAFGPQWSHDGKKIYYRRSGSAPDTWAFFEVDVDSQTEREVVARAELLGHPSLSPDGRWIATTVGDKSVWLFPVGQGEAREVFRAKAYEPQGIARYVAWTPDGGNVLIGVNRNLGNASATPRDAEEGRDLMLVPATGGQPRKIHVDALCCEMKIHPDGKQLAFLSGERKSEVWVLENFLPPQMK
jgi:Tol biopolymer transport system component